MTIPKQWLERPISPTCYFCDRPAAWVSQSVQFFINQKTQDQEHEPCWVSHCLNHQPLIGYPVAKLVTAGCHFEGVEAWVR